MKGRVFLATLALAFFASYAAWRTLDPSPAETITDPKAVPPEASPMCSWREPDSDLKAFFPQATSYQAETRILSGLRAELTQRLHRPPTGDENVLRLNRIYQGSSPMGAIFTRRVKGQYGAIEIVLATDNDGKVHGLRLQRLREPDATAAALQDTNWLVSFAGKSVRDSWLIGRDLPDVPATARESAEAVVDGVRSLLVLSEACEHDSRSQLANGHHN